MFKAAIIGGTGYGGAELCRQLLQHDKVELVRVSSIDHVGKKLGDVHLNLEGLSDLRFVEMPATEVVKGMDVVFLGLPHTVSSHIAGEIRDTDAIIIDLSGDFRLLDVDDYNSNYSTTHPYPELLGTYAYGFPELNREEIRTSNRIASPGCHATSVGLTLLPLAKAGLLDGPVFTTSATGSGSLNFGGDGMGRPCLFFLRGLTQRQVRGPMILSRRKCLPTRMAHSNSGSGFSASVSVSPHGLLDG